MSHLGHGGPICRSGENDPETFLPRLFFRKTKTLSTIVGALSKIPVKKYGHGLLNPVTSAQAKYLSSHRGSSEMIWAMTGGGAFFNADHLHTLGEERRDRKKNGKPRTKPNSRV